MGAAKRRRTAAGWQHSEGDACLLALHAEAGGVLRLTLVTSGELLKLAVAALAGDGAAAPLVLAAGAWLQQPTGSQTLCETCDRRIAETGAAVLAVLLPERDNPTRAMVLGLCPTCCAEHGNDGGRSEAAVLAVLRRWWPDLRLLAAPSGRAGRA